MDIDALNNEFRDKSPAEIIRKAIELSSGSIIVSTNFRPLEAVILHMCTEQQSDMPVIWADSGYMMPQTYIFAEKTIEQLNLKMHIYNPLMTAARRDALYGDIPGLEDEDKVEAFSEMVKLEPFRRGLADHNPNVWITSLRKEQNPYRETLDVFVKDGDAIYHTYSTYGRGLDILIGTYNWLDLAPNGRDEDALDYTMSWVRRHDEYEST